MSHESSFEHLLTYLSLLINMQWAPRNVARAPHVLILGAQRAPKKFSEAAALCFSVTRDYIHKNQLAAL